MREPDLPQVALSLREQGQDAPQQANPVLGGLRPAGSVLHHHAQGHLGLAPTPCRADGESDRRIVEGQVPGGSFHSLAHRGRVAHSHGQGVEDAQILTLSQAQPEVGTIQIGSRTFQQVDQVLKRDEGGELVEHLGVDPGIPQQPPGVAAQVDHQFGIASRTAHGPWPSPVTSTTGRHMSELWRWKARLATLGHQRYRATDCWDPQVNLEEAERQISPGRRQATGHRILLPARDGRHRTSPTPAEAQRRIAVPVAIVRKQRISSKSRTAVSLLTAFAKMPEGLSFQPFGNRSKARLSPPPPATCTTCPYPSLGKKRRKVTKPLRR
jgi:hypothetical protein